MKALKLKGWVDGILGHRPKAQIATVHWFAVKPVPDMVRATLVIGDERVFTESEVREIAQKMNRILAFGRTESSNKAVASMLALHGIVLDPA